MISYTLSAEDVITDCHCFPLGSHCPLISSILWLTELAGKSWWCDLLFPYFPLRTTLLTLGLYATSVQDGAACSLHQNDSRSRARDSLFRLLHSQDIDRLC